MSKSQDSILNSVWVVYRGEKPKYTTDTKCWNNCEGGNLAQLCDGEGNPVEVMFFSSEKKAREEARKHDDAHVDKISIMVGYEAWWQHNAAKQKRLIDVLGWAFIALTVVPLLTIIGHVLYEHTVLVAQALICSGTGLYLLKKAL